MPRKKLDNEQITFRLPSAVLAELKRVAETERRSINVQASIFIEQGITAWLAAHPEARYDTPKG